MRMRTPKVFCLGVIKSESRLCRTGADGNGFLTAAKSCAHLYVTSLCRVLENSLLGILGEGHILFIIYTESLIMGITDILMH